MEQNLKSILDSQSLDSVPKLQAFARERLPLLGTKPEHLIRVGNHQINPALASIEETITVGIRLHIKTNGSVVMEEITKEAFPALSKRTTNMLPLGFTKATPSCGSVESCWLTLARPTSPVGY